MRVIIKGHIRDGVRVRPYIKNYGSKPKQVKSIDEIRQIFYFGNQGSLSDYEKQRLEEREKMEKTPASFRPARGMGAYGPERTPREERLHQEIETAKGQLTIIKAEKDKAAEASLKKYIEGLQNQLGSSSNRWKEGRLATRELTKEFMPKSEQIRAIDITKETEREKEKTQEYLERKQKEEAQKLKLKQLARTHKIGRL